MTILLIKDDLQSKIMNSRLFHLQGIGCKIVNCTQDAKKENWMNKQKDKNKSIYIDRSHVLNDKQT